MKLNFLFYAGFLPKYKAQKSFQKKTNISKKFFIGLCNYKQKVS
jgi:hypothetical protein